MTRKRSITATKPPVIWTLDDRLPTPGEIKAVEDMLTAANGAAERVVKTFTEVFELVRKAENDLSVRGVPKAARQGTLLTYKPAGPPIPSGRPFYPMPTTRLELIRNRDAWLLGGAFADKAWQGVKETFFLRVTEQAGAAIIRKALTNVRVEGISPSVLHHLAYFAPGHWYAIGRTTKARDAFDKLVSDTRIVTEAVHATPDLSQKGDFALYSTERKALEASLVVARLSLGDEVRFDVVRKWDDEP